MSDPDKSSTDRPARRVLEPIDRVSEVLFGLIMVLTFTGSLSVAEAGREDVREMLIGAIGCNIAWGIVDAIMYLMGSMTERARARVAVRAVKQADRPQEARERIAGALPEVIASVMSDAELETVRQRLVASFDESAKPKLLTKDEWLGALGVFLLVFLCTFPVVLPFLFMSDAQLALRVSNAIAIVMLFGCGYSLGKFVGGRPWALGVAMVIIGAVLAGMTLALGG